MAVRRSIEGTGQLGCHPVTRGWLADGIVAVDRVSSEANHGDGCEGAAHAELVVIVEDAMVDLSGQLDGIELGRREGV